MSRNLKIFVEITIKECNLDDSDINTNSIERIISDSYKLGGTGLSKTMWKIGVFHDMKVRKLIVKDCFKTIITDTLL